MAKRAMYINSNSTSSSASSTEGKISNAFTVSKPKKIITISSSKPKNDNTSYEMTYDSVSGTKNMPEILASLHRSLNIYESDTHTSAWYWDQYTNHYNRFKVPTYSDMLQHGFGHVFFVRPSCNIFKSSGANTLTSSLSKNSLFVYAQKNCPSLLKELTTSTSSSTFMLSLSNKINNFNVNEEYLSTNTYGKTYSGYQLAYGKNNIESKSSSTLSLEFMDDKFLHVYQLHKLWIEYISGVFRGLIEPTDNNVINKILDYAGACYYILTSEDGETIIYWEKYYGLFPTNIDSSAIAWSKGTPIQNPNINVTYQYSFRNIYDPVIFSEFNHNSALNSNSITYAPTFDKKLGHTGSSWVGVPYIELETNGQSNANPYTYKLRFKEKKIKAEYSSADFIGPQKQTQLLSKSRNLSSDFIGP